MQINSISSHIPQYNTTFKQAPQLKEVLLRTSETSKVPLLQKSIYRQYLDSKNLPRLAFDKQELDKLFAIERSRDFAKACFKGMVEKLNLPKKIAPKLVFEPVDADFIFGYERTSNSIIINTNDDVPPKNEIFALIRHEFQHYLQNIDLLRSEEYGEEHINNLVNVHISEFKENTLSLLKDDPKNWEVGYEEFKHLYQIKRDLENGSSEHFEKDIKEEGKAVRKSLKNLQKEVIKSLGVIKASSPQSGYLKKLYKGFQEYDEKTNEMDWDDYLTNYSEYEAVLAETATEAELENKCLVNFLKERCDEFLNSEYEIDAKIKEGLAKKLLENPKVDFIIPKAG